MCTCRPQCTSTGLSHSNLPMNQVSSCRYSLHEKACLKFLNKELHSVEVVQNPKSVPFPATVLTPPSYFGYLDEKQTTHTYLATSQLQPVYITHNKGAL